MPKFDSTQWDSQIYSTGDFLKDIPTTTYLVKPVLVLPSLNVWYGTPGSLKTNLLIDLAVCVALGRSWLTSTVSNFTGFDCSVAPVFWVDCDSGREILHERFSAFLRGYALNPLKARTACIHWMSFANPAFNATKQEHVNAIVEIAKKRQIKMLVFDNLGTISGGADENSFEMVQVMNSLRYISEKANVSVNVIHHIAKNVNNGDTRKKHTRYTPRGHSSIEAAIDTALYVDRDGDGVTVTPTKCRRAPFDPFLAIFEYEHYAGTETLKKASFLGDEGAPDAISVQAKIIIKRYIREHEGQANQAQLVGALGAHDKPKIGRPRALSEIHRLVRKNELIVRAGQAHNTIIYTWKG